MAQTVANEHDTLPPSLDPQVEGICDPPSTFFGIARQLGPGLIIAGSIVGSGELIATTKTGAQAGISLLWLIVIGCLIKVFVQVELGRYTITHGETTLSALNQVPGPRARVNWIVWYWLVMMVCSLAQLGGIVGGVGQALAISFPVTGDYARAIELPSQNELQRYLQWSAIVEHQGISALGERERRGYEDLSHRLAQLNEQGERGTTALALVRDLSVAEAAAKAAKTSTNTAGAGPPRELAAVVPATTPAVDPIDADVSSRRAAVKAFLEPVTWDDRYWAAAVTVVTMLLLYRGSYGLIQSLATAMVVGFTFITIGNVIALQNTQQWHISAEQIWYGLSFHLPEGDAALVTALATFGIIGVGATELVAYPYWCLEKGYAKFTGPRDSSSAWAQRARGWMRVMHYDAWASMLVYTVATLAFFLMGVAVLYSEGRDPDGMRMVSTLATAYVPVFGEYARWLFLIGAVAVLYSTFLVANAGHARTFTDAMKVFRLVDRHDQRVHDRLLSFYSVVLPLICLGLFVTGINPVKLVLLGGTMQAIMLPMLGFAALYFRRYMSDSRLRPSPLWDVLLVVSCIGLFIAGGWNAYSEVAKLL